MKPIDRPRDDNPKQDHDFAAKRIRLICTDCEPHCVVTDRDVSYWEDMPSEMVENDGACRGVEDMIEWLKHIQREHGIVPSEEALKSVNAYLASRKGIV